MCHGQCFAVFYRWLWNISWPYSWQAMIGLRKFHSVSFYESVRMGRLKVLLTAGALLSSLVTGVLAANPASQPAQQLPLINPKLLSVAEQKKCFTEDEQEYCAEIRLVFETTGLPWLDSVLLTRLDVGNAELMSPPADMQEHLQRIKEFAAIWVTGSYEEIKSARESTEPYNAAYEHMNSIRFLAQRNHLASFKQFTYGYSGGAHGMYSTHYLLFDLNTQQQLLLSDLLQVSAETKLLQKLRTLYLERYADYAQVWLSDNLAEQAEALLTDNFVFNEQGLTFSYPPYGLGPYSEGEVRLTLTYDQLTDIIKPEYVLDN